MSTASKKSNDLMMLVIIQRFFSAAMALMGCLAILVFVVLPIVLAVREPEALTISLTVMVVIGSLLAASGVASVVVGVGLVRRQVWARWGEAVLSALGLLSFPLGTIIGGLVLVYLFSEDGQAQFES